MDAICYGAPEDVQLMFLGRGKMIQFFAIQWNTCLVQHSFPTTALESAPPSTGASMPPSLDAILPGVSAWQVKCLLPASKFLQQEFDFMS